MFTSGCAAGLRFGVVVAVSFERVEVAADFHFTRQSAGLRGRHCAFAQIAVAECRPHRKLEAREVAAAPLSPPSPEITYEPSARAMAAAAMRARGSRPDAASSIARRPPTAARRERAGGGVCNLGLQIAAKLRTDIEGYHATMQEYLPKDLPFEFNWGSPKQRSALIFGGVSPRPQIDLLRRARDAGRLGLGQRGA